MPTPSRSSSSAVAAALVLAALLLPATSCTPAPAATPPPEPLPPAVRVAPVELRPAGRPLTLHGLSRARSEANVAFSTGGRLEELTVRAGDPVSRGQLLARLDATPHRRRVEALEAKLAELEVQREQVARDRRRVESLAAQDAVPAQRVEQVQTQDEALAASEASLRAQLAEAVWARDESVLRSPLDGAVVARLADRGEVVGPGTPVLALRAGTGLEVELDVPERWIGRIQLGDVVPVAFPLAGLQTVEGEVVAVGQGARPGGLFPVRVALPDELGARPGLAVTATFPPPPTERLVVPIGAVVDPAGGAPRVHRVADGTVQVVPVEVLDVGGDAVAVAAQLLPGDDVVVAGHVGLVGGEPVRIRR